MARRRKSSGAGARTSVVAAVLVAVAVGCGAWYLLKHRTPEWSLPTSPTTPAPEAIVATSSERVDPANEGHRIRVEGGLRVAQSARDVDLGVHADALALVRTVQMRQWRETCAANDCDYALVWSDKPIDSHGFRVAASHANTTPFPFSSRRFTAGEVRLGAYAVEPVAALAQAAPTPHAVDLSRLPPNLAASFRAQEGALLTGDPAHPAQGDLRVSYSIVPIDSSRTLVGVQRGGKLVLDH